MYRTDSFGSWSSTARATVSPPTPESKMPIGASAPRESVVPMLRVRLAVVGDGRRIRSPRGENGDGIPRAAPARGRVVLYVDEARPAARMLAHPGPPPGGRGDYRSE